MGRGRGATDGSFWGDAEGDLVERYQALVAAMSDGVVQLDEDGRFVAANDAFLELLGVERDELLGAHVSLVLGNEDVGRVVRAISGAPGSDDAVEPFDVTVHTADGDVVPCELRLDPLRADGATRGAIGVARVRSGAEPTAATGASTSAASESTLESETSASTPETKASESTPDSAGAAAGSSSGPTESPEPATAPSHPLSTVLDEADVGVFLLDDEFEIAWIDETIERYFGLDREAVIGRDKRQTIEDTIKHRVADSERFEERVLATYDDNSYVEQFECRVTPEEGGESRWLEHYSTPIESGRYAGGRIEFYTDVTDRKRSEDALRETEAELESLIEAIEEYAIVRLDADGRVRSWNEGAEEITGYEPEAVLGEHLSTFYTEADRTAGVPERDLQRAAEKGSVEDEGWRLASDDTRFWARTTIHAVRDDDGDAGDAGSGGGDERTDGYLLVLRDMTERHERELELEHELQRVLGRISDAFYAVDDGLQITHVNERAEELLEAPEEELLGEHLWDAFPAAAEMEEVRDAFRTAQRSQESTSIEFYYDPLERWFEANLYPSETGISVYFRDVTERRERERALDESRKQLRALVEILPVGVFVADADGSIVEWNETAEELWGGEIPASDSVDEYDAYDGWWADTGEPVAPGEWPMARALRGEEVTDPDEIVIERFDGERRTILNHGMPVRDEDGEVSRAVVTLVDITERKEYERRLEESNERLEQFAYAASHDLKEPLRMVSSYLQLLDRQYGDELDEDGREYVEFAVDGVERMRAMIDGLLEYSRVETQGDPFEPVDLDAVLADVRADLQVQIREQDAEIVADDLPRVEGDPNQLRQVFQNLLENAIEYSGDEPPRIEVTAERDDGRWVVSVSDEGVGIDDEHADRIFEVFQRLHTQAEHPGTGIGLALCQRIVERHGGEIWVESEAGEGATFSFTLPAVDGDED